MAKRVIDRMQGYSPGQMVTGVYKGYATNFGFLITDDKHEDIYIGKERRGNAMHNDTVQVEVLERGGHLYSRRSNARCQKRCQGAGTHH